jgi:hypothetical protein
MPGSPITPDRLADRYAHDLSRIASVAELTEIRRRNGAPMRPARCASHDFHDADAIMASAFRALAGRAPDPGNAADRTLVAEAWKYRDDGFAGRAPPGIGLSPQGAVPLEQPPQQVAPQQRDDQE